MSEQQESKHAHNLRGIAIDVDGLVVKFIAQMREITDLKAEVLYLSLFVPSSKVTVTLNRMYDLACGKAIPKLDESDLNAVRAWLDRMERYYEQQGGSDDS